MSYEDYDLNPVRLALDLASFADGLVSLDELLEGQQLMFTDHGYPAAAACLAPSDVSQLVRLGAELSSVLDVAADQDFIAQLAALLAAQDCRPQLTKHDGEAPHLHFAPDGAPLPRWVAAMAVCRRWYVDESKNSSRRYCSPACASRTTVAAYRARGASAARQR